MSADEKVLACDCRKRDAWRCAVDRGLTTSISCPCECHREPPQSSDVVDRVAKAIYAARFGLSPDVAEKRWPDVEQKGRFIGPAKEALATQQAQPPTAQHHGEGELDPESTDYRCPDCGKLNYKPLGCANCGYEPAAHGAGAAVEAVAEVEDAFGLEADARRYRWLKAKAIDGPLELDAAIDAFLAQTAEGDASE